MKPPLPPAILLAGQMIALAAGRSLTAAGIPVHAFGDAHDPLRYSRDRRSFVPVRMGDGAEDRLMSALRAGPREGVIIPCNDDALELLACNRSELVELGYQPTEADDDVLLAMLDKERTFQLATEAGIEAPWVQTVRSAAEARAAVAKVGYPCALKPRHSHLFGRRFSLGKAFVVENGEQLEATLAATQEAGVEMMITEIVPGPDSGICSYYSYIDEHGQPLFDVTKRKLRQHPPQFGLGCYHVTDWIPEVAELGLRFFQGVGVRGLVNVEFKRDERDGRLKLIECNHRLTSATEQLRRAGADLPLFTYNRTLGRPVPSSMPYRLGLGYWYPLSDVRAFSAYRRDGELTAGRWLRSLARWQTFPLASIRDPGPSLGSFLWRSIRGARRLLSSLRLRSNSNGPAMRAPSQPQR